MEGRITILKGKITKGRDNFADIITSLDDNEYTVSFTVVNPLISERDYQKAYFAMLDTCVMHTGNNRYTLHEMFKEEKEIKTTKNLSVGQWQKVLKEFQWWAFGKMDVIL